MTTRLKRQRQRLALPGLSSQVLDVSSPEKKVKAGALMGMGWPLPCRRIMDLTDGQAGNLGTSHHLTVKEVGRGLLSRGHDQRTHLNLDVQRRRPALVPE